MVRETLCSGPPHRQLELSCDITHSAPKALCIVGSWIQVQTDRGALLAEGNLFYSLHAVADWAIIRPKSRGSGRILIDLPQYILSHIEEHRAGGDLRLQIRSRVLVLEVSEDKENSVLGAPWQTQFNAGSFNHQIPKSEWVKLLRAMAWSELELLEFPNPLTSGKPALVGAIACLRDAQECYRNGMWHETVANCRKAFERLVKDTLGVNDMGKSEEALKVYIKQDEKTAPINELANGLTKFQHLARHERNPPVVITKLDAEFSLRVTGALLNYAAAA